MSNYYANGISFDTLFNLSNTSGLTSNFFQDSTDIVNKYKPLKENGDNVGLSNNYAMVNPTYYIYNGNDLKTVLLPNYIEIFEGGGTVSIPSYCKYIKAILIGGGGGSGGSNTLLSFDIGNSNGSSGGGGGAYADIMFTVINGMSSFTYIVGAGGGAGEGGGSGNQIMAYGTNGEYGWNTSITYNGVTYSAGGGGGGSNGGSDSSPAYGGNWGTTDLLGLYSDYGNPGAIYGYRGAGGGSGFSYTYKGIYNQSYGKGGDGVAGGVQGGTPGSNGNIGNGGYLRIYFCI